MGLPRAPGLHTLPRQAARGHDRRSMGRILRLPQRLQGFLATFRFWRAKRVMNHHAQSFSLIVGALLLPVWVSASGAAVFTTTAAPQAAASKDDWAPPGGRIGYVL